MHELGYCEALLPAVERRAAGRPVRRIGIRAGSSHRLVGDVMQMAWTEVARDTPFADATTVLCESPMQARCPACDHRFETDDMLAECPGCGTVGPRLSGGDEFVLEWLEYVGVDGDAAADGDGAARERVDEGLGAPADGGHHHHDHDHHDHDHHDHHDHDHPDHDHDHTGDVHEVRHG